MAEIKKQYKHIFFDLDHTLWDFKSNSTETLEGLFEFHGLQEIVKAEVHDFLEIYYRVNEEKWSLYRQGAITKETLRKERFLHTLQHFGCEDEALCSKLEMEYVEKSPHKTGLIPGTREVLDVLREKYELHIITNGFSEAQGIKLQNSGLRDYFREVITSEMVGVNKPSSGIFVESMRRAGATRTDSLMVGDSLVADIIGARNCGIDQVYFNPESLPHRENVTFEIRDLKELLSIL